MPVGSKPDGASVYGALDMSGNIAEWTASAYAPYPRLDAKLPASFGGQGSVVVPALAESEKSAGMPGSGGSKRVRISAKDPRLKVFSEQELQDTRQRVYRGGSYNSYARFLRSPNRQREDPEVRWLQVGRCARCRPKRMVTSLPETTCAG